MKQFLNPAMSLGMKFTTTIIVIGLLFIGFPVSRALGVSDNLVNNGGFEDGTASGWLFGQVNRAVYPNSVYPGAQAGNYWLDTSIPCSGCVSDLGDELTVAYDVLENTVIGQRYSAEIYFRSPQ